MATKFTPKKNKVTGTKKKDKIVWQNKKAWKKALTVNAGAGNDTIDFSKSKYKNKLNGEKGHDSIVGGTKNDTITGGKGNDIIKTGKGTNTIVINKGDGNDTIYVQGTKTNIKFNKPNSKDKITAFEKKGNDLIVTCTHAKLKGEKKAVSEKITFKNYYNNDGTLKNDNIFIVHKKTVRLSSTMKGWKISGVKNVYRGTAKADTITGSKNADTIYGNAGNDKINAGNGNDKIDGGAGNDNIYGESGTNTLIGGKGTDKLYSGTGADTFKFASGDGADTIYNATSLDKIEFTGAVDDLSYSKKNNDLVITRTTGTVKDTVTVSNFFNAADKINNLKVNNTEKAITEDALINIVGDGYIEGTNFNDNIITSNNNSTIIGGKGNDILNAGTGVDTFKFASGDGNDMIINANSDDIIEFTGTVDKLEYEKDENDLLIKRTTGDNVDTVKIANYYLSQNDNLKRIISNGVEGVVSYIEDSDNNTIEGTNGSDLFSIKNGNNNTIICGDGDDTIITDNCNKNYITGGKGADTFYLNGLETFSDTKMTELNFSSGDGNDVINFGNYNLSTKLLINESEFDKIKPEFDFNTGSMIVNYGNNDSVEIKKYTPTTNTVFIDNNSNNKSLWSYFTDLPIFETLSAEKRSFNDTNPNRTQGQCIYSYGTLGDSKEHFYISTANGNDVIYAGGKGNAWISTYGGDDEIHATNIKSDFNAYTWIDGGKGNDTMYGGTVNDIYYSFDMEKTVGDYDIIDHSLENGTEGGAGYIEFCHIQEICKRIESYEAKGKDLLITYKITSVDTAKILIKNYMDDIHNRIKGYYEIYDNDIPGYITDPLKKFIISNITTQGEDIININKLNTDDNITINVKTGSKATINGIMDLIPQDESTNPLVINFADQDFTKGDVMVYHNYNGEDGLHFVTRHNGLDVEVTGIYDGSDTNYLIETDDKLPFAKFAITDKDGNGANIRELTNYWDMANHSNSFDNEWSAITDGQSGSQNWFIDGTDSNDLYGTIIPSNSKIDIYDIGGNDTLVFDGSFISYTNSIQGSAGYSTFFDVNITRNSDNTLASSTFGEDLYFSGNMSTLFNTTSSDDAYTCIHNYFDGNNQGEGYIESVTDESNSAISFDKLNELKGQVASWIAKNTSYSSVEEVIQSGSDSQKEALMAIFTDKQTFV